MANPSLPTIVLIAGAWYPPSSFSKLTSFLSTAGYPTVCASVSSTSGLSPLTADCDSDAQALREDYLRPLIEVEGKDVLIVAHSYGAMPGSGAAAGFSKPSRAKEGQPGGVIGIVFVTAFIVQENGSMSATLGGQWPPFVHKDTPSQGLCIITTPAEVLFPDAPAPITNEIASSMLPQAIHAFESPAPAPVWLEPGFVSRCMYIRCLNDILLPPALQDMFIATVGKGMSVKDIQTAHSPQLSAPQELSDLIVDHAEELMKME